MFADIPVSVLALNHFYTEIYKKINLLKKVNDTNHTIHIAGFKALWVPHQFLYFPRF